MLDVIKVEWTSETEVHIYPPDNKDAWLARPVKKYFGDGEVWQLLSSAEDVEGHFPNVESMLKYVSEEFDDAPVIVTKELQ